MAIREARVALNGSGAPLARAAPTGAATAGGPQRATSQAASSRARSVSPATTR